MILEQAQQPAALTAQASEATITTAIGVGEIRANLPMDLDRARKPQHGPIVAATRIGDGATEGSEFRI